MYAMFYAYHAADVHLLRVSSPVQTLAERTPLKWLKLRLTFRVFSYIRTNHIESGD